jgi:methionine-rich copper-binding protein CopC
MRKITRLVIATTMLGCSTAAHAHAQLDHASPAVGSTVSGSPGSVTLYFTEKLEPKFSGAEVKGPAGRVDHGASVSGNMMRLDVRSLTPGSYSVNWHVLSVDTHKTQGSFNFTVK